MGKDQEAVRESVSLSLKQQNGSVKAAANARITAGQTDGFRPKRDGTFVVKSRAGATLAYFGAAFSG
jgi:hypothetical protein